MTLGNVYMDFIGWRLGLLSTVSSISCLEATLNAGLFRVLHLFDCLRVYSNQAKVEAKAKKIKE